MNTLILSDVESAMLASLLATTEPWLTERAKIVNDLLQRLAEDDAEEPASLASATESLVLVAAQERDSPIANGSTIFIGAVFHSYDHHDIVGAFLTPEEADAAGQTYGDSLIASGIGRRRLNVDSYSITVSRLVVGEAQATQISERHVEHDDEASDGN